MSQALASAFLPFAAAISRAPHRERKPGGGGFLLDVLLSLGLCECVIVLRRDEERERTRDINCFLSGGVALRGHFILEQRACHIREIMSSHLATSCAHWANEQRRATH